MCVHTDLLVYCAYEATPCCWDADALDDAIQLAASGCARVDQALREVLREGAEEAATLAGAGVTAS